MNERLRCKDVDVLDEVIKNGNKVLTKLVGSSEQTYEPTTAKEKQDRRNEIKARGTLLMALPNKDQLKFHSYQDAIILIEAIKKRLQKLISQLELQGEVLQQKDINLKLLRSLPFEWKTHALIWRNKTKLETIKQINPDDLEEMDIHWEMAMLTIRARRAPSNQDNRGRKYERTTVPVETPIENALIGIRGYDWRYQAKEETSTNYAFMALISSGSFSSSNSEQKEYKEKGVIESGCSRHMTGNKCYLTDFEAFNGGFVSFRDGKGRISGKGKIKIGKLDFDDVYFYKEIKHMTGNKCYLTDFEAFNGGFVSFRDGKGRISGKGKIKIGKLDFDDVYFYKEIKYNLFSVSQMCDKKNNVLFTDTECLVLSSNFKLLDESQVLLRVLRKDNIYSVDLKSVVPTKDSTCLFNKATLDKSNLWYMRLGHINFKTMNKLVKGNFVREVVNTGCYVLNRALVTKPHNKTPYELIHGRPPLIDFMKPFG
nr:putative ribonuclease H-like domain-containing protein [Tanacetum cinerariifolium]